MGDYKPQVGHRVRGTGTREGVVTSRGPRWTALDDQPALYDEDGWEWERLPDPEPDWQPGDLAKDANGLALLRVQDQFAERSQLRWIAQDGRVYRDRELARPLTPLVLNGKPVTDGV